MCRTAHAVISVVICGIQMLVRVFMTFILMLENVFRLILQTLYNFISFLLQMLSLIPICLVFLLTTRLKCFMCGGGGPCPVNRGGGCDCLMSAAAIVLLFFIFRAVGLMDKIFYKIGYVQAPMIVERFSPTPGDITECSREGDNVIIALTSSPDSTIEGETTTTDGNFLRYSTEIYLLNDTETELLETVEITNDILTNMGLVEEKQETEIPKTDAINHDTANYFPVMKDGRSSDIPATTKMTFAKTADISAQTSVTPVTTSNPAQLSDFPPTTTENSCTPFATEIYFIDIPIETEDFSAISERLSKPTSASPIRRVKKRRELKRKEQKTTASTKTYSDDTTVTSTESLSEIEVTETGTKMFTVGGKKTLQTFLEYFTKQSFIMCRTIHAILSTAICGIQMLVRVFMTVILMLENLIRMILQTLYNFISFMLQLLSLIPICVIFLVTTRLKCFMCGGGGPCPVNRGGACDCLMSAAAIVLLYFIFRAVGLLDKIFYKIGYVQAPPPAVVRFVPTPGDVTECSREVANSTDTADTTETTSSSLGLRYDYMMSTETETILVEFTTQQQTTAVQRSHALTPLEISRPVTNTIAEILARLGDDTSVDSASASIVKPHHEVHESPKTESLKAKVTKNPRSQASRSVLDILSNHNLTTVLYYLV